MFPELLFTLRKTVSPSLTTLARPSRAIVSSIAAVSAVL